MRHDHPGGPIRAGRVLVPLLLLLFAGGLLLGLGGCSHEEGASFPSGGGGFGLTLVMPPEGSWDDQQAAARQDSLWAWLYRLGPGAGTPYSVRPDPDSTAWTPAARGRAAPGEALILEVDIPEASAWWRLFVNQGSLRGESTFELSPRDRERNVYAILGPRTASEERLVVYPGLEAGLIAPHRYGTGGSFMLFPVAVETIHDLTGLSLRFSLAGATSPGIYADPGSRLFASGDTLGFTWEITALSLPGNGCDVYEARFRSQVPSATVAAGSGLLFYLAADGAGPASGLCVDRAHVSFVTATGEHTLDESAVTTPEGCEFLGCDLAVTYPSGAEQLCEGEPVTLAWTSTGCCSDSVRIDLLLDGSLCNTITAAAPNSGTYSWTAAACGDATGDYAIRVTDRVTGDEGVSSEPFSINPGCSLLLEWPNGGELLCEEETHAILWHTASCCSDSVRIELYNLGEPCRTIASAAPNTGIFDWEIAACNGATEGYAICIVDRESGAQDCSNAAFSILPGCALALTHPTQGQLLCEGSDFEITWNYGSCCGSTVSLSLYREGEYCAGIAAAAENVGVYTWTVAGCGPAAGYTIEAYDETTGARAESDPFEIGAPCTLALTHPAAGGVFCSEQPLIITWEASACCSDSVRIELLRDGSLCLPIASPAPNTGRYAWIVEACGAGADGYSIRVSDDAQSVSAESPEPFAIAPACDITITFPESGDTLCEGATETLTWMSTFCCGPTVTLELLENGTACATLAGGIENDGAFEWNVAGCGALAGPYALRITDDQTGAVYDMPGTFAIEDSCAMTLLSPVEDESYCTGDDIEIRWIRSTCCDSLVRIDLLLDGQVCAVIASATENDGAYDWPAAPCAQQTGPYSLRITTLESGAAIQSETFWIHPACTLAIIAPSGGSVLCEGESFDIAWNASSCCGDSVRIQLLLQGDLCATIASSAPNDGEYSWTVTSCGTASSGYALRIVDLDTGAADVMPETFSIESGCQLALLHPSGAESFCEGEEVTLAWSVSACCGETAVIELLRNGQPCSLIADETPNDGLFTWTAARCGTAGSNYSIRVTDSETGVAAASETFTIEPPCAVVFTNPTGGETLCEGEDLDITWSATPCCGSDVSLELLWNGAYCQTITTSTANDGTYTWPIAQCEGETGLYSLRLETMATGVTAPAFTIQPACSITVTDPHGGGVLIIGHRADIAWSFSDCCGSTVSIELLRYGVPCATPSPLLH